MLKRRTQWRLRVTLTLGLTRICVHLLISLSDQIATPPVFSSKTIAEIPTHGLEGEEPEEKEIHKLR